MDAHRIFSKLYIGQILASILILNAGIDLKAQVAKTQVVQLQVTPDETAPSITLEWDAASFSGNYDIYRRESIHEEDWGNEIVTLPSTATSFVDTDVVVGESYEYRISKYSGASTLALGYIEGGLKKEAIHFSGNILILIDSAYHGVLDDEVEQLHVDMINEGWHVKSAYISRNITPNNVKDTIAWYDAAFSLKLNTILLLGHIPVPYSGDFSRFSGYYPPDGHAEGAGNHTGAWPADVYYADRDGSWTDNSVTRTSGNQSRHHNIPGDGKFDQSKLPSDAEFEVGRVDFYDMPAFNASDTVLMRNYLNRNHAWRTGQIETVNRAIVDNNFGGLNLASTGYHNFSTFCDLDSISDADFFTELKAGPHLWAYGCGAGSYTSCSGVGNTNAFATDSLNVVFNILAGSYFGDWDIRNNLMRASLANSALAVFWGGIPKWYVHPMALGTHIGWGAKATQNNDDNYFNGSFNGSNRGVFIALLGDPTLKMQYHPGAKNLTATDETTTNFIELSWDASNDPAVIGYNVYRFDSFFTKQPVLLNTSPISGTQYSHFEDQPSGPYTYMVRSIKIDSTASGTYENLGNGSYTSVYHSFVSGLELFKEDSKLDFLLFPNPSSSISRLKIYAKKRANLRLEITNIQGQILKSESVEIESGSTEIPMNISSYATGVYLVRATHENVVIYAGKLIVE